MVTHLKILTNQHMHHMTAILLLVRSTTVCVSLRKALLKLIIILSFVLNCYYIVLMCV